MTEAELRDAARDRLKSFGYDVETEVRLPAGGCADLVVWKRKRVLAVIEAKLHGRAVRGAIGQLVDYTWRLGGARRVLLLPSAECNSTTERICRQAGITLWSFDEQGEGDPFAFRPATPLACGCVQGVAFCEDARESWIEVGLAHARNDLHAFALALTDFGGHLTPDHLAFEVAS